MTIRVEVVYALPQRQWNVALELPEGATVREALETLPVRTMLAKSAAEVVSVGVWGRIVQPDHPLRDRDRLEIYRGLLADPKSARRRRASTSQKR
jgi:putative ubiquitin-RnfH superfamily antitoxin RatB of RatAB toxin-antitoxin module